MSDMNNALTAAAQNARTIVAPTPEIKTDRITTLSPEGSVEDVTDGFAMVMMPYGSIWMRIDGVLSPFTDRYMCNEVAERWLADARGPRGAALVAAVRAGDERGARIAWRQIGR